MNTFKFGSIKKWCLCFHTYNSLLSYKVTVGDAVRCITGLLMHRAKNVKCKQIYSWDGPDTFMEIKGKLACNSHCTPDVCDLARSNIVIKVKVTSILEIVSLFHCLVG